VLKDTTGVELPPAARKTIDLEGRIVKDGVREALRDRQLALADLCPEIPENEQTETLVCPEVPSLLDR
jgi:hypothetical protein